MKRRQFESLARQHLDATLNGRGFVLCPQPPPDHEDERPQAIYEDQAADFPRLGSRLGSEVIDIEISFDPGVGRLSCAVDGASLSELLTEIDTTGQAGQLTQLAPGDLATQFHTLAAALDSLLDAHIHQ